MSFILGYINKKWTCLAYGITCVYFIDFLLMMFKAREEHFNLPYEKLILLVGVLHIVEGLLTYLYGSKQNRCIVSYKRNQITGGYEAYRKWYIPLFLFTIKGFYIPLLCVIAYGDETYTMKPEEKARKSGKCILSYGLFILLIGILISLAKLPLLVGIIVMPVTHEILFVINHLMEKGNCIYNLPARGVRVIEINHEQRHQNKIKRGDIILKINGKNIIDEDIYYQQLLEKWLVIMLQDMQGNIKILNFDQREYEKLEVIILPTQ